MIQLSYPWALLSLLSLPIIFILYSLRPKRRTLVLSTTSLWREALREQQRGLGLQKLLRDLSLILLLLIALALAIGLAGPQWLTRASEQADTVLVLDVSASMKVGSRFSQAMQEASDIVDSLPSGSRIAIMTSGSKPVLRSAFESNKETLRSVLSGIEPTDEAGQPRAALTLALSLLRNREQGRIYFITDAAFDDQVDFATPLIEYRTVGDANRSNNIAITQFDFRPEIGTEERFQMLLTVRNYTKDEVNVPALVSLDRKRLYEDNLQLAPDSEKTIVIPFRGRALGSAQAQLEFDDDLAADNQAFAVMDVDETVWVLLVSKGNFYLESVFTALPNVRLTKLDQVPSDDDLAIQARRHDLVVFDRVELDDMTLPAGNYLLLKTLPPELPFYANGVVEYPVIAGKGASPLVRQMDLSGVKISSAQRITGHHDAPGLQRLFWSKETDLALAWLQDDIRLIYLGFDLAQSNFPLQAAFPLFIRESLAWLRPNQRENGFASTQIAAGETFVIAVPATQTSVIVGTPSGEGLIYQIDKDKQPLRFDATSETGIYRYRVAEIERYFAVNLTDADESDITPRANLPQSRVLQTVTAANTAKAQVTLDLWPYLIMIVMLLLTLEWCLWCMRRGSA